MKVLRGSGFLVLLVLFLSAGVSSGGNDAEDHYTKGVEYASEGNFIQARDEFKEALQVDPGDIRSKSSLKAIEDAIALKVKKEAVMHDFKGVVFDDKGMLDKGITEFTRAIEIDPEDAAAYENRGSAYIDKGQYDRAISDLNKAIELDPKFAEAYYNRGNAYDDKGQYDRTISDFTKAIEIEPQFTIAITKRGFVYMRKLGKKTMACKDWKRACELGSCEFYSNAKRKGDCR